MRTFLRYAALPLAALVLIAAAVLALVVIPARRRTGRLYRVQVFVLGFAVSLVALWQSSCSPIQTCYEPAYDAGTDSGMPTCYDPAISDSGTLQPSDAGWPTCYEQILPDSSVQPQDSGAAESDSGFIMCYDSCYVVSDSGHE